MDDKLIEYIENNVFPLYNRNEEAHGIKHIKTVIKRSLGLAEKYNADLNIAYTVAAYHDLGHYVDAKTHEIISAQMFMKDETMKISFQKSKEIR